MADKLSQDQLEQMLLDTRWESEWRAEADQASLYYDGRQLSSGLIQEMRDRGLAPLVRNLVGPTIDLVLGIEAKSRRDWKAVADKDEDVETAAAMSAILKQAERTSDADKGCSDAYASMIKTGVGWVEVARESNPFRSPFRIQSIPRREIYWDFRAKAPDLSDARYLVRKQWLDEDIAALYFPKKANLIKNTMSRWADWDEISSSESSQDLLTSHGSAIQSTIEEAEWLDTDRRRICLYEVWYRNWVTKPVMTLPSGQVMELDEKNPKHLEAVAMGLAQVRKAVFPKVRLAWWAGPHFLADIPSPYPHSHFPYVPFWGYREDTTGVPYGLIRRMMSPQDEVNARLSKMVWLLSAKRVIGDSDALDMPWHEVAEEVARPDSIILLNPNRKNKNSDALRIESDFQLSQQQFSVLQDATKAIQDAAGVYQSMLGKSEYSGQSGAAINSLVEQGSTTLAELNDNYRFARKQVGTLLLSLIVEDIGTAPLKVSIDADGERKSIELNTPTTDEAGFTYLTNDVVNTQMRVDLTDIPETPSYKLQQFQQYVELAKSLPPEVQPLFADFVIRASDLPFRKELADRVAKQLGFASPETPTDPAQAQAQQAEQQAQVQAQQAQQQMQDQMAQLQLAEQQAKVNKAEAEAELARAKAQHTGMQAIETDQRMTMAEDDHVMSMDERALQQVQALEQGQQPPKKPATQR